MDGIVSLLDEEHYKWVEDAWSRLHEEFGLRGIYITPFPHFTYHVAEHYEVAQLEPVLQRFAARQPAFEVQTAGVGIFTGANPTVHIPLVRNPQLTQFHQALWQEIGATGSGVIEYYRPERWLPHITLAHGDVDNVNLPHIIRFLSGHDYYWNIPVNNLTLVYSTGTEHGLRARKDFPLAG
jgi:2'-5' RNA ligase